MTTITTGGTFSDGQTVIIGEPDEQPVGVLPTPTGEIVVYERDRGRCLAMVMLAWRPSDAPGESVGSDLVYIENPGAFSPTTPNVQGPATTSVVIDPQMVQDAQMKIDEWKTLMSVDYSIKFAAAVALAAALDKIALPSTKPDVPTSSPSHASTTVQPHMNVPPSVPTTPAQLKKPGPDPLAGALAQAKAKDAADLASLAAETKLEQAEQRQAGIEAERIKRDEANLVKAQAEITQLQQEKKK